MRQWPWNVDNFVNHELMIEYVVLKPFYINDPIPDALASYNIPVEIVDILQTTRLSNSTIV